MAENLRVARLYFLLLAIVTLGRWLQSVTFHTPYEKGHHVFSIVILTFYSTIFFAAFCRRWRQYSLLRAAGLGVTFGLASQLVILLSTLVSYALGISTYFTHPTALNVPDTVAVGQAMKIRLGGLVANTIFNAIAAALGWVFGGLLPSE